ITNTEATKGRILDADIAKEQLESTRLQILQQTATAQLAQANILPQNVLALFQ
ncbi:flagellin, partial [bacterium SM23_31]